MGTVTKQVPESDIQSLDSIHKMLSDHPTIYVFGYGSLLWKPDFQYKSKQVGYIKDYERRFYQGNVTFRGRPGQPGRVANLVESIGSQTWGVAYEVTGKENVTRTLQALYNRETTCGGYISTVTTFYPRDFDDGNKDKFVRQINCEGESNTDCSESVEQLGDSSVHLQHLETTGLFYQQPASSKLSASNTTENEPLKNMVAKVEGNSEQRSILKNIDNTRYQVESSDENRTESKSVSMQNTSESHPIHNGQSHSPHQSISRDTDPTESLQDYSKPTTRPCPLQVLLFTATPDNDLYLGPDTISNMARHIVNASGTAGSNVEYVTKIAEYVRRYIPEDTDSHLFQLDAKIREEVYRKYVSSSERLQLGFSDLSRDVHSHEILAESVSVMAS